MDNKIALVLTPTDFNNILAFKGGSSDSDIASFSIISGLNGKGLAFGVEVYNGAITNDVDVPLCMAYLQNNQWYIPSMGQGGGGSGFGEEGQTQYSNLKLGEIVFGPDVPIPEADIGAFSATLWNGSVTIAQPFTASGSFSIGSFSEVSQTFLIEIILVMVAVSSVVLAVFTRSKKRYRKHR